MGEQEQKERDTFSFYGDQLTELANEFYDLAAGRKKPHTKEAHAIGLKAKQIIRYLVLDWM